MFHGDPNFSDFSVLGAQSVMAGMDFDADGNAEILFTIDETLPPGGPDPGKVGVYLYESDGNGGYSYVWHFVSPDPGNSLPGLGHGDIDADGNHEITLVLLQQLVPMMIHGEHIFLNKKVDHFQLQPLIY